MGTGDVPTGLAEVAVAVSTPPVIPLENGDRLRRCEFEARYLARPDIKKAELIEGVVHVPSPVRATHAEKHGDLLAWLRVYSASTAGVSVLDNATVRLDRDNEPQPDVLMRIESAAIGQSQLDGDDYVTGAPELVVEVVASSAAYDLHDKLHAYRRNGVLEYLVWRVYDRTIDWFVLTDDEYRPFVAGRGRYSAQPDVSRAADGAEFASRWRLRHRADRAEQGHPHAGTRRVRRQAENGRSPLIEDDGEFSENTEMVVIAV